jgi:hypothetical protein
MALTQTLAQMRAALRRLCDIEGTSMLTRHPDADCNDYINRGLGALRRKLTQYVPDLRILSSTTINLTSGTSSYALPADFEFLISVELDANGRRTWLEAYAMNERPMLSDPNNAGTGVPVAYRLRGANIDYQPAPGASGYTSTLWYVPDTSQLSSDSATLDTIQRLDDYAIFYAGTFVAKKDEKWSLHDRLKGDMAEIGADIAIMGRNRDVNSPPRVVDVHRRDRFGASTSRKHWVR